MGGLIVATEAGVPENIVWMQSGHAQDRRECSTRQFRTTTSRPVTRISRRAGDSLPTQHSRAWYEARRSCPLEQYLHRMRQDQPASQETRIRLPRQDTARMSEDGGPGDPGPTYLNVTTSCQPPGPPGPGTGNADLSPAVHTSNDILANLPAQRLIPEPGQAAHGTKQPSQSPSIQNPPAGRGRLRHRVYGTFHEIPEYQIQDLTRRAPATDLNILCQNKLQA
jgi:hypothetical protein